MHEYHYYDFTVALPRVSKNLTIIERRSLESLFLFKSDTTTEIPVSRLSHQVKNSDCAHEHENEDEN